MSEENSNLAKNYIDYIYNAILMNSDTSTPVSKALLKKIFSYFTDYVFCSILEQKKVQLVGLGTFSMSTKSTDTGLLRTLKYPDGVRPPIQFYPKFRFSPNYRRRIRQALGTNTASEVKTLTEKDKFRESVWETKERFANIRQGETLEVYKRLKKRYQERRAMIKQSADSTKLKYNL